MTYCPETHTVHDELQPEARRLPPGSEGLLFIPHFSGRVLPNNPHLKGASSGLDFKHTRGHMYRAILESIAYEYDYYLSVLKGLYPEEAFDTMLSVGGGANSTLFNQIKADVLGVRAATLKTGETALIGSAVIAGVGVGLLKEYSVPILSIIRQNEEFMPDPGRHLAYQPYCEAYLSALEAGSAYYSRHPLV